MIFKDKVVFKKIMSKIIKDCIFGFVEVPTLCRIFMDTSQFQRLRRIKQLGLTHYVFPTATHTRFDHSLGVMYLAGKVIDQLSKFIDISERKKQLVMLAGLLHDVGHFPFSHLFDTLLQLKEFKDSNGVQISKHHEIRSVELVKQINQQVKQLNEKEVEIVQNMILGNTDEKNPFLYEIVCNSENGIDVDKMMYLRQDAYNTGIMGFQPDYIIHSIRIKDGHIAFLKKAETDIRDLYETRKRMFQNVYYHKTITKIERMYLCM